MIRQGSGVMLFFGGDGEPMAEFDLGGLQVGLTAIESLRRQLAMELGRHGIRVLSLQTGGVTETLPDEEWAKPIVEGIAGRTMLGRAASLADVGNVAAFAASDLAASLTGTKLNISVGAMVD